jgi:uncharacterized protein YkwD/LysM repeat protein
MGKPSKLFLRLTFVLILVSAPLASISATSASSPHSSTAYELIDAVNALRATRGLAPYQSNSILMGIAQAQAEYMAAIGVSNTHMDAQGLRPYQRALAAGYLVAGDLSNGSPGWFSENVTGGSELSAQDAVNQWMGDAAHQGTMLSDVFRDVGTGVAIIGNTYYYCLDTGLSTGGTPVVYTPPAPLHPVTPTIVPNTPNADGSILHIVQVGDTLGSLSLAYKVPLEDILKLNNLTLKSTIYVNQKIIIRQTYTPTPTLPTSTPTIPPTSTPLPSSTSTSTATRIPPTPTPSPGLPLSAAGGAVTTIAVSALVLAGLIALLGRKRR